MREIKEVVVWSACKESGGAPTLQKSVVGVTQDDFDLGIHYDLADHAVEDDGYEGPYIHFDHTEVNAISSAANEINPISPVIISNSVDAYPEVLSNPGNIPVSLLDYQLASDEINANKLSGLIENYGDKARHDDHGYWYVEQGNVHMPTWIPDCSVVAGRTFFVTSQKHGGLAANISLHDDHLIISVHGKDESHSNKPSSGDLKIGLDQLNIHAVPDIIQFEFKTGSGDLEQYSYVTFLGIGVTLKQEYEGIVVDVSPDDFSEAIDSTYVYYDEINSHDDSNDSGLSQ